jgi:MYXO-CTERM domain-containing protein
MVMLRPFRFGALVLAATLAAPPARADDLENWPCKGCFTHVPNRTGESRPERPLLVALHGDGGGASKLFQAWKAACDAAGVILMAPRCPTDVGCSAASSWWQWYFTSRHDPAWLGAQVDAVTARFPVDPARIYATGYSGGATYLGYYVPQNPQRFAAVAHVAGGKPFSLPCPACKLPVLFVIGATDPMITPFTRPLREYYDACGGHEVVWEALRGVTHEGIVDVLRAGRSKSILSWLLARPASCLSTPPEGKDAGLEAGFEGGVEDGERAEVETGVRVKEAGSVAPRSRPERPPPGCACGISEGAASTGWGAVPVLLGWIGRRRRRPGSSRLSD